MQARNRLGDIAEKLGFLTGNWHYIKPLSRICFTTLNDRVGLGHVLKNPDPVLSLSSATTTSFRFVCFTNKHVYKLTMAATETGSTRDQPRSLNYWLVTNIWLNFH